jgi:hypothetical protein
MTLTGQQPATGAPPPDPPASARVPAKAVPVAPVTGVIAGNARLRIPELHPDGTDQAGWVPA